MVSLTSFLAGIVKSRGHVYTYDVEPKFMKIAEKNIKKAGMSKYVTMNEFDFKKAKKLPHSEVDLVVVDLGDFLECGSTGTKDVKGQWRFHSNLSYHEST